MGRPAPRASRAPVGCGASGLEPCLSRQRRGGCQKGGAETGPNPTDRGKAGTKRHLVVDRRGTPLGVRLSPANRHDSLMLALALSTPCQVCVTAGDDFASGQESSTPTRPTIIAAAGPSAAPAPSRPALQDAAWTAARDSAGTAGLSSARWLGSAASAAWQSATSDAWTSISPSPPWAAPSSASTR